MLRVFSIFHKAIYATQCPPDGQMIQSDLIVLYTSPAVKKDTLFNYREPQKPYPILRTYLYSPYIGVPPGFLIAEYATLALTLTF